MYCKAAKDYDMRVQIGKGKVHAAYMSTYGGFTRYVGGINGRKEKEPVQKVVYTACSWKRFPETSRHITNKNKTITCKNCQKAMGLIEGPVFPNRFVIRKKDTGEFYKNTRSRCSVWAEDLCDAWFWKRQGDARRVCKRTRWYDENGNVVPRPNYREMSRFRKETYYDPNLEIIPVEFKLGEAIKT
jgi:hypothetical protein